MTKVDVIRERKDVVVQLQHVAAPPTATVTVAGAAVEVIDGKRKDVVVSVLQPMQPSAAVPPNIGLVEISTIDQVVIGPPGPPGEDGTDGLDGPPGTTYIGDDGPAAPIAGQLWWESDLGQLLIWYDDGNSAQWVSASTPGPAGPPGPVSTATAAFIGADPPTSPFIGQLWWESDTGQMFIWYQDINSAQWVPTSIGSPGQSVYEFMARISALEARLATLEGAAP